MEVRSDATSVTEGFWGKVRPSLDAPDRLICLPLSAHCLDVARVFRRLVGLPTVYSRLEGAAGGALDEICLDRLAVLALLHDLGKANLGFQAKLFDPEAARAGHVRELAPLLFEPELAERLEATLGQIADWFTRPDDAVAYFLATWSHHGRPLSLTRLQEQTGNYSCAKREWWQPNGGRDPFSGIEELLKVARHAYPSAFSAGPPPLPSRPSLQHRFAGLVMLADWLGSHESFFPVERQDRFDSRAAAERAVEAVGLEVGPYQEWLAHQTTAFPHRFGFAPRPLQALLGELPTDRPDTRLLIVEAETGSGKTEAALDRFFDLFAAGQVGSLYFALPTRVAAREIYQRVVRLLERNFPDPCVRPAAVLAVPGYARFDNVPVETLLPSPEVRYDEDEQRRFERLWAAERPKRFLAATVAVGTVDQALLSAVQARHAHLRSVCLDRSLLVVDEVHASDPYMLSLLERLLAHHVGQGGHALLLSATLGSHARNRLVVSAGGNTNDQPLCEAITTPYPALTGLTGQPLAVVGVPRRRKRVRFDLRPWLERPEAVLGLLVEALDAGARVLVILNTVSRVIALQKAVEAHPGIPSRVLFRCARVPCPHHGRFSPADRELLDEQVTLQFGQSSSPGPLLLIGTQTLEQSLDIDADFMVTDLCPADVLLQRVGRLHRHERPRPAQCEGPRCLVLSPRIGDLEALLDTVGEASIQAKAAGLGSVYEDLRPVELTRRLLTELVEVSIPENNRQLVEAATHPECLSQLATERWVSHADKVEGAVLSKELAAHFAAAVYDQSFGEAIFHDLPGDSRARTRLGLDTLRISLATPTRSPFGVTLNELVIPGHMAPKNAGDLPAELLYVEEGTVYLRVGDREYSYSRFGLEGRDAGDQSAR